MNIKEIIKKENILLHIDANSKIEAFNLLAESLEKTGVVTNKDLYVQDVLEREKEFSTGIGFGFAIPHAKSKYVTKASVAVGRLKKSIKYDSIDDEPINFMFMIAVPIQNNDEHLKILSTLSRKFIDEDFRNALEKATTKDEIMSTLELI
ncbi:MULTISPECIES: PTS sugar transporter subunit IIA [Clostridium]|uniref:PTS sugar transporter subunit IIA n=1 Tax=Clostridium TaxID=1485 RepID=UPI000823FE94|nr:MULTISPECIES: PTS sugar transporter subunit IIA [Clostridium]PJI10529.1 PTS fructose transporter subunit IIA [Clostridium sp. CT7]